MKILMLGWEFPPLISGGLATATEGLVSGLTRLGHQIALVLPHFPHETANQIEEVNPHLTIVSPEHPFNPERIRRPVDETFVASAGTRKGSLHAEIATAASRKQAGAQSLQAADILSHYETAHIESLSLSPEEKQTLRRRLAEYQALVAGTDLSEVTAANIWTPLRSEVSEQTEILSLLATDVLRNKHESLFEVIHAHDWMSLKAISNIKGCSSLPVVLHVHSTEFDRAGLHGNQKIQAMEKLGFHIADRLVAVSNLTRRVLTEHYGVPSEKIDVVYNASNLAHVKNRQEHRQQTAGAETKENQKESPLISFVGRVTYQKGPAYFVQSAHRALQLQPDLRFQVVGTGDLLPSMRQLAWELGILDKFTFHGFQSAKRVESLLASSDVFVMPSVSEPFGIVALEAMAQDIPIIISKQSGVAECLMHALKVDFWDTELMADRIVNLVRRNRLRQELRRHGSREVERFTWETSARRCVDVYMKTASYKHGK
ncbi:MAG: glycosyltransferase [Proteobacteria bacterium]|nr:glycosyltransferase [Pseudomonadota bacterium]